MARVLGILVSNFCDSLRIKICVKKWDLARYSKGISDLSSIYKGKLQCSDMISENDSMRDTTIMIHEFVLHPKTLYRYFRTYD